MEDERPRLFIGAGTGTKHQKGSIGDPAKPVLNPGGVRQGYEKAVAKMQCMYVRRRDMERTSCSGRYLAVLSCIPFTNGQPTFRLFSSQSGH